MSVKLMDRNRPKAHGVAIVGAGYISDFHAMAIRGRDDVELIAVCDADKGRAEAFASRWGGAASYSTLDEMLSDSQVYAAHILAPPDRHFDLAKRCLDSGVNVFVEKPLCVSTDEADQLLQISERQRLQVGVNHNMLFSDAYLRLRDVVNSKSLGPIDCIDITHALELGQIRMGPYDNWMLRSPANILLELGPHLVSIALDLLGPVTGLRCHVDRPFRLPNGTSIYRRWRIDADVGPAAVRISVDLSPGFSQRTVTVHGLTGCAQVDFDADTCLVDQQTKYSPDIDRLLRGRSIARSIREQSSQTFVDYCKARLGLRVGGNPYEKSFRNSIGRYYDALQNDDKMDYRLDCRFGRQVVALCLDTIDVANLPKIKQIASPSRKSSRTTVAPTVLVLGATGFIGRELVRQLIAAGLSVRTMVRGSSSALLDLESSHLEVVRGNIRSEEDLTSALKGIKFVYHLARADAKSWEDYQRHDIEPTRLIAKLCLEAGVERLVYTGTIDSYYAGKHAGLITESTPLDPSIRRRNYYARAKATCETYLMDMYHERGLPVVIVRPGIVIGKGGNPFHWGVGRWVSPGVCEVWGDGLNKLPFVLVADVADGLVRCIMAPGVVGKSYNLVDLPLVSAREYLAELQLRTKTKIKTAYTPIWRFYFADLSKWVVKMAVRHHDRFRKPSYWDWESRTQRAVFESELARRELGWKPASSRDRIFSEGIGGSLENWIAAIE